MSRRSVVWSAAADGDLKRLVAYIAAEAPLDARKLLERLVQRVEDLAELPGRGRRVPELASHPEEDVREVIVAPYRVIYEADERRVLIHAVVDGRRDLQDLLLERLM